MVKYHGVLKQVAYGKIPWCFETGTIHNTHRNTTSCHVIPCNIWYITVFEMRGVWGVQDPHKARGPPIRKKNISLGGPTFYEVVFLQKGTNIHYSA